MQSEVCNMQFEICNIVKDALAGEEAAWNSLYQQFYPGTYAIALKICGNTAAAKDAVQEAFTTAFLKLSQLKDPSLFEAWLKKIVTHYCYRSMHSVKPHSFPSAIDKFWEDEMNTKMDALSTESRLFNSLSALPEVLRSTLLLRYCTGFSSYQEIAEILSIPVGTVRSRLNQARQKLLDQWLQQEHGALAVLSEREEWNQFYYDSFGGLHQNDVYKNKFINHLERDIQIVFTSGKSVIGSRIIDGMVHEDRQVGSWFAPFNVQSCGNISIVEAKYFNSPEHPDHCPDSAVCVLYRDKGKVMTMNLYNSPR